MASSKGPRPASTASSQSAGSLMQDLPGAYPAKAARGVHEEEADEPLQSLSQTVHARRAEYVRSKEIRIKIGTWNVASHKGTEKDLGDWFVQGKGVVGDLSIDSTDDREDHTNRGTSSHSHGASGLESIADQEVRYKRKHNTLPKGDSGCLPGADDVGLYVLGLQEVVDISSASEALRPYTDPSVAMRWKDEMQKALPRGYTIVAEQQLLGLLLLVFASADLAKEVRSVSTTSVGTGLMGYMGNKGAVTARILVGETTRMVFVNAHLAAGSDKAALERRNWDAAQIVSRTRFDPIQDVPDAALSTGEEIGDEDFAFWVGDLNYRLEGIPGDDVRRLLMLHTRNEYDLSIPSVQTIDNELTGASDEVKDRVEETQISHSTNAETLQTPSTSSHSQAASDANAAGHGELETSDPASLQTTLSSLLPHDELHQQMKAGKAFHDGWKEGPITFLPTYKYDVGSVGVFDSSEKKRAPSWCDRILYRTRRDKLAHEALRKEEESARKKDEELRANGTAQAAEDEDVLYAYDPEVDGTTPDAAPQDAEYDEFDEARDGTDGVVITQDGFEDRLELQFYTAHQRVLSSDHKPLDAVFKLRYDAVVPDLKLKVHNEVAKEMDKLENDGRPSVTVVVDKHNPNDEAHDDDDPAIFQGVNLGDVRWAEGKHRSLTIANTGRVPATVVFIKRPVGAGQAAGIAPKWLHVKLNDTSFASSETSSHPIRLEPGETCPVELSVRIMDVGIVRALNEGIDDLDDVLVLRVEGGRDHFIPVRGSWQESSLGRSIDKLCRIPEGGIRRLQKQKPHGHGHARKKASSTASSMSGSSTTSSLRRSSLEEQPVRFSAPRELFRLTEAIEELVTIVVPEWEMINAPKMPSVAITEGAQPPWEAYSAWPFYEGAWDERATDAWTDVLSSCCDALDCDQSLTASLPAQWPRIRKLYMLCNLLLEFLRSIPDHIISVDGCNAIDAYLLEHEKLKPKPPLEEQRTAVQEILLQAGASQSISFVLLVTFLERLICETVPPTDDRTAPSTSLTAGADGSSSTGTLWRMTGLIRSPPAVPPPKPPSGHTREQSQKAFAKTFVGMIFCLPQSGSDKVKAAQRKRFEDVLNLFLAKEERNSR